MSQYKYGMYVKTIAKIKQSIIGGMSDSDVQSKYNINEGQLGFIHDVLLKKSYRSIDRRLSQVEEKIENPLAFDVRIGTQVKCQEFGIGVIVKIYDKDPKMPKLAKMADVEFSNKKFPVLINLDSMSTNPDGKVRKIKRLT